MRTPYLISKILFLLILTVIQINAQNAKSETINILPGSPATIDGKIDEKEWQDSVKYDLSGGGQVFFKYDGNYVYVAVQGVQAGWSHLYLSEEGNSDIAIHHASAALGKSIYKRDQNNSWQPLNSFSWELRDRLITEETRKKMADYLSKNYWVANNNNMGNPTEIEFQLKPQQPSTKQFLMAIVYASGAGGRQFSPAGLNDDCLKSELVSGNTLPNIKFETNQWARINLKNSTPK